MASIWVNDTHVKFSLFVERVENDQKIIKKSGILIVTGCSFGPKFSISSTLEDMAYGGTCFNLQVLIDAGNSYT